MKKKCIVCNNEYLNFKTKLTNKIYFCTNCDFFESEIINDISEKKINYTEVLDSISYLRIKNFTKILNKTEKYFSSNPLGLEVGCSTGIFMELAEKRNFKMVGLEPMQSSFNIAKNKGLNVINKYFSKDFYYDKNFDFIIFNDVFEHIPQIEDIIKKCNELLNNDGLLIINLPISTGILYKAAKAFNFFGISMFLERLWQFNTVSPHLYYFNNTNLKDLLSKNNFSFVFEISQKTFTIKGLFKRINSSIKSKIISSIIFVLLIFFIPFISILPKDTNCLVFKKTKSNFS